jgi:hypothetical protein
VGDSFSLKLIHRELQLVCIAGAPRAPAARGCAHASLRHASPARRLWPLTRWLPRATGASDVVVDEQAEPKASVTGPDAYRHAACWATCVCCFEGFARQGGLTPARRASPRSFYHDVRCRRCTEVLGRRYISVPETLRDLACVPKFPPC